MKRGVRPRRRNSGRVLLVVNVYSFPPWPPSLGDNTRHTHTVRRTRPELEHRIHTHTHMHTPFERMINCRHQHFHGTLGLVQHLPRLLCAYCLIKMKPILSGLSINVGVEFLRLFGCCKCSANILFALGPFFPQNSCC